MHKKCYYKSSPVQKTADFKAASVLDLSSQGELLQRKADLANGSVQREERPNNTGMPDNLKAGIESLSGFSMDDVRVHYNSSKPATVQALAYTQGTDIHVAPGQEKHLPHEAWHVAQQMAGRVSPTTNINGMPVNDNATLEREADVMGERAVQCKNSLNNDSSYISCVSKTIQCGRAGDLREFGNTVLKINFAGSGYDSWGNQGKGLVAAQVSGKDVLLNMRENSILEYSFPGPSALYGTFNTSPSIGELVASAEGIVNMVIGNRAPIHLLIKGHSRGAVAAGELYKKFVTNSDVAVCEVTMLDPVPGPDGSHHHGDVDLNIDDTGHAVDQGLTNTGKVVFFSLGISRQNLVYKYLFSPQRVQNANIYIFSDDGHSCYVDTARDRQQKKDRYSFNGMIYTYSQLSGLQNGYYHETGHNTLVINGSNVIVHVLSNLGRNEAIALVRGTHNLSDTRRNRILGSF